MRPPPFASAYLTLTSLLCAAAVVEKLTRTQLTCDTWKPCCCWMRQTEGDLLHKTLFSVNFLIKWMKHKCEDFKAKAFLYNTYEYNSNISTTIMQLNLNTTLYSYIKSIAANDKSASGYNRLYWKGKLVYFKFQSHFLSFIFRVPNRLSQIRPVSISQLVIPRLIMLFRRMQHATTMLHTFMACRQPFVWSRQRKVISKMPIVR